jgi:hypothetical protein
MIQQILTGSVFVVAGATSAGAGGNESMLKYDLLGGFAFATLICGTAVAAVRGSAWAREPTGSIADGAPGNAKLVADLRESIPYLKDASFHQTAIMIAAAANEIERLQVKICKSKAA